MLELITHSDELSGGTLGWGLTGRQLGWYLCSRCEREEAVPNEPPQPQGGKTQIQTHLNK